MILSDLLDRPVHGADGDRLGVVVDVRFTLDGPVHGLLATPRLYGLIVSPRTHSSFLGYERTGVTAPALLAHWFRWRERGSFLVLWEDLASLDGAEVRLREGATRYSSRLTGSKD